MNNTRLTIYKIAALLLIAGSVVSLVLLFLNTDNYSVRVKPASDTENFNKVLQDYKESSIEYKGQLLLKEPGIADKLIWPPAKYLSDFSKSLFVIFMCIQVLFIIRDYKEKDIFRSNIPVYIRSIGLAMMILYFINLLRGVIIKNQVISLTNNEFRMDERFVHTYDIWIAVLLLWLSVAIKKGSLLQKEQDLTI